MQASEALQRPVKRTRQVVLDAVLDLHATEQVITRQTVADASGLKMSVVDEHLQKLVSDELIRRVERGVFVPVEVAPPARAVSVTQIPGGCVKLEVGDMCLDLWPREARAIASLLSGYAQAFHATQLTASLGEFTSHMAHRMRRLEAAVTQADTGPGLER